MLLKNEKKLGHGGSTKGMKALAKARPKWSKWMMGFSVDFSEVSHLHTEVWCIGSCLCFSGQLFLTHITHSEPSCWMFSWGIRSTVYLWTKRTPVSHYPCYWDGSSHEQSKRPIGPLWGTSEAGLRHTCSQTLHLTAYHGSLCEGLSKIYY